MSPEIDYVILANHAEVVNGLMYISGGGVTEVYTPPIPAENRPPLSLTVAIGVIVPWTETNKAHTLKASIEDADGATIGDVLEAVIEAGRAPGMVGGTEIHPQVAWRMFMPFPAPGAYRVRAEFVEDVKTVPFRVHPPNEGLRAAG